MAKVVPTKLTSPRARWTAALALTAVFMAVISLFTLTPANLPTAMPRTDKAYHLIGFAVLVFPAAVLFPRLLWWVLPGAVLFGGAIELIQPRVGRSGEFSDFIADASGIAVGVLVGLGLYSFLKSLFIS